MATVLLFGVTVLLVAKVYIWRHSAVQVQQEQVAEEKKSTEEEIVLPEQKEQEELVSEPEEELQKKDFPSIPFYIQAPQGQWSDPLFQNACEEASMLMVVDALANKTRTPEETTQELQKIASWQKDVFGTSVDTDSQAVTRTLKEYFSLTNVQVEEGLTVQKIQAILESKAVILVPLNGQKLQNPHFTPPGPKTYMVVVFDYNQEKDMFVAHDPGTKFGKNYEYKSSVLETALGDYPTGNHLPYQDPLPKTGVSVRIRY